MNPKSLNTLEFPKILNQLAEHTSFSAGHELALNLLPSPDVAEVKRRQQETTEARRLLDLKGDISLAVAHDLRPLAKKAEIGSPLTASQLLDIRDTLLRGRSLRRAILRLDKQLPLLATTAQRVEECPSLVAEIARCIDDRGEVVDGASPTLAQIRRDLNLAHDRLLNRLERIIASPRNRSFLQEPLITQREGRYVIPLKADFKGRIPGIIHDTSASGVTLFIEPLSTVELGNRWRQLQLEEEKEVERILRKLTAQVAEEGQALRETAEALAQLDLAVAKAKYSEAIKGVEPILKGTEGRSPGSLGSFRLLQARHPLLPPDTVVPIDVHIGDDFFILIITGPNTGGKTVSLKTVGLLALMAQAGLHIPAAEGSSLPVFNGVYADIGEEQSIEQSLSTFSSHMTNIINILKQADERSLVLLDELGAGTDPVEGSALARAILSYLRKRHITSLVATHYSQLKAYAHVTPGVQNACVEFDPETLAPTYQLTIGLPGRSNALAIATHLGLWPEITKEAKTWLSPEDLETESLLAEIRRAREEAVAASQAAQRAQREAEERGRALRERLTEIEQERREIVNQARGQAQAELAEVREELRRIRGRLEREARAKGWLERAVEKVEELAEEVAPLPRPPVMPLEELKVGDRVWVESLGREGEIIALLGDEVELQIGKVRAKVPMGDLRPGAREPRAERPEREYIITTAQPLEPSLELNLRGLRVEEALPLLDKYLNEACLAGLSLVRIIHGKGTGALRRAVRDQLADHPLVASFRPGDRHEGGDGATVVELVSR